MRLQILTLALFTSKYSKCSESNLFFSTCSWWYHVFLLVMQCRIKFRGRATKAVTAIRTPCEGQIKGANTKEEREFTLPEQKDRRHRGGVLEGVWMKSGNSQECVYVFVLVHALWSERGERKKKQEERTAEELLMALLLSLSADCDSQDQLLSKTTSPRKRRKCSQEVIGVRERSGQSYVEWGRGRGAGGEVMIGRSGKWREEGDGLFRIWLEWKDKMERGMKNSKV